MGTIKVIAKNSIVSIAGEVFNKLLALFLTIILARYLGDSGFGQYSFVIAAMMLFQIISDFGLDALTVREVAKNTEDAGRYLSNILILKIAISAISCAILIVVINFTQKPAFVVFSVYLAGLALIFYSIANTFSAIFNAFEKLEVKALVTIVSKILLVALTLLAVFLQKGLLGVILAILMSEIFRAALGWLLCNARFVRVRYLYDRALCRNLLRISASFAVISFIALIYFKVDIFMLSFMKGDQVVGWYSAAYGLLSALIFIAEAYNLSVYPVLSRYAISAKDMLGFGWSKSIKYLFIIGAPIAFGTTLLADRLIPLFYSASYANSVIALKILIWTLPWILVNAINVKVLYATNNQNSLIPVIILSTLINIILNLILIPSLSYAGASIATLVAEILNVFACFWIVKKTVSFKFDIRALIKPLIASFLMGLLVYCFRNINLALLLSLGAIGYFTVLISIGSFDENDKMIIAKLIPKNGEN